MITTSAVCVLIAFILFFLAALGVAHPRVNLIALGLAFYMLSLLVPVL